MTQYIDKDKVIEYVKQRLISIVTNGNIDDWERGANNECINFLSFINSLPEEPVSEEEIEALNDVRHLNPGLDSLYWKLKKS